MTNRRHRESGWRAAAFATALFAITLNFLQPLAHAALMRDGPPSALWSVFCNASPRDTPQNAPLAADKHECCLGLAHAAVFAAPTMVAVAIEPVAGAVHTLRSTDDLIAFGIRDGPHRPRGPPLLA